MIIEDNKVSYKKYISSFINQDCTDALLRIYPKINMDKIFEVLDNTPGLSDIRKDFFKIILSERYNQILKEPYLTYKKQFDLNYEK